jgi:hypothetical protein
MACFLRHAGLSNTAHSLKFLFRKKELEITLPKLVGTYAPGVSVNPDPDADTNLNPG